MKLVQYNEYLVTNVLWHQGINLYGAEYSPMDFQLSMN